MRHFERTVIAVTLITYAIFAVYITFNIVIYFYGLLHKKRPLEINQYQKIINSTSKRAKFYTSYYVESILPAIHGTIDDFITTMDKIYTNYDLYYKDDKNSPVIILLASTIDALNILYRFKIRENVYVKPTHRVSTEDIKIFCQDFQRLQEQDLKFRQLKCNTNTERTRLNIYIELYDLYELLNQHIYHQL